MYWNCYTDSDIDNAIRFIYLDESEFSISFGLNFCELSTEMFNQLSKRRTMTRFRLVRHNQVAIWIICRIDLLLLCLIQISENSSWTIQLKTNSRTNKMYDSSYTSRLETGRISVRSLELPMELSHELTRHKQHEIDIEVSQKSGQSLLTWEIHSNRFIEGRSAVNSVYGKLLEIDPFLTRLKRCH